MIRFRILCFCADHLPMRLRSITLILHAIFHNYRIIPTLLHPHDAESYLDDCDRCADEMR